MSVLILKIIAVFGMICDHIRYVLPAFDNEYTKILGRIAFPIFAFLITEGYSHTKNIKKYIIRLGIFSLISQIPFLMFVWGCNLTTEFELNVIFTMLIGVLALLVYDKIQNKISKFLGIILLVILAEILKTDYGAVGVMTILNFYIFKDTKILKYLLFLLICIGKLFLYRNLNINYIIFILPYIIGYIFSIIPIALYNKKIGKFKLKYFFYIFYPLHMFIFFILYKFIN